MQDVFVNQETLRLLQAYRARSEYAAPTLMLFRAPPSPEKQAVKDILHLFSELVKDEKDGYGIAFTKKKKLLATVPLADAFKAAAAATSADAVQGTVLRLNKKQDEQLGALKDYLVGKAVIPGGAAASEVLAYAVRAAHQTLDTFEETGGKLSLTKGGKYAVTRHISGFNY